ncbi:MAG TPA: class I SAM-dependent RNA methyltransferase [Geobacteraceae bacterium]|nr:class I SAM-dependent RNA methyltransferase [Geobacteraceae bacterium]
MVACVATIEKMAFGGAGFGHLDGKALFVPLTAPGDVARISIRTEKRSYLEGELVELIQPSARRIDPPCPVFGRCGGCNWQHLPYPEQLKAKEEIFAEILWRSARVERERIGEIVQARDPFGYRSRVQLKLRFIEGRLHMGFYRPGSHFVVDIPGRCAIAHPRINHLLDDLRRVVTLCPEADKIPQIDVAVGEDAGVEVVIHYIGLNGDNIAGHFERNSDPFGGAAIFLQSGRKSTLEEICGAGSAMLSYRVPDPFSIKAEGYRLEFSHGGFSQVNYRQNRLLIETVCEWSALKGGGRLLDLYCGNGNFSLPLSGRASHILGVEDYAPSIVCARRNCAENGVFNAVFHCSDAVSALHGLVSRGELFDLVLLDPPRSGARDVAQLIPALGAKRIIYVSCDPMTLARDLSIIKKGGYSVVRSLSLDMFPQTFHTESVTLLEQGVG